MSEPLQILIVEDDAIVGSDLSDTLARCGYEVIGLAGTVERAMGLSQDKEPDLLLIDLRLGQGDAGIEVAERLRDQCDAPVVFMTGFSSEESFRRAKAVHPAGFLRKPFSAWELQAVVESAMEHAQLQQRLETRSGKFLDTLRNLNEAVVVSGLDGKITFFNPSAETLTGYKESDVIGRDLSRIMIVRDHDDGVITQENEEGKPSRILSLKSADGQALNIIKRSVPLKDEQGEVTGLVTLFRLCSGDLSDEQCDESGELTLQVPFGELFAYKNVLGGSQEEGLESGREENAHLIEEITDPLLTLDEEEVVTYANPEGEECLRKDDESLIGQQFHCLFSQPAGEECKIRLREVREIGKRQSFEIHDEERERWFELNVYSHGSGWLILLRDTTARQQEMKQRLRAHRMEGLSLMARGFTHDFNNLLTVLIGNLSLVKDRYLEDEGFQSEVIASSLAADKARRLVQQLMTFTKGGVPILTETRVAGVLRRVLEEHRKMHKNIRYQLRCSDPSLRVKIDPEQIALLIENLIKNAEEAMPEGGKLEVVCELSVDNRWQESADHEGGGVEGGSYVVIKIIDEGHGMDDAVTSRAFEPYFTTRKEDNASGIGLTVCESIAKAHRGHLELNSLPGEGLEACLYLPLELTVDEDSPVGVESDVEEIEDLPAPTKRVESTHSGALRILILEDEELIRQLIVRCLRKQGYEVVESKEGNETIRLYKQAREEGVPFDLILSDLTIEGGMGGIEMMQAVKELDPNMKAIVSSGYSDAPAMANPEEFGFSAVLPKPYPTEELIQLVRSVLSIHPHVRGDNATES